MLLYGSVHIFFLLLPIMAHVLLTFVLRIHCAGRTYADSPRHVGPIFTRLNSYSDHNNCILVHNRGGFFSFASSNHIVFWLSSLSLDRVYRGVLALLVGAHRLSSLAMSSIVLTNYFSLSLCITVACCVSFASFQYAL